MELRNLFTADDDRAVSPVIGVILMVAITVILAAVIGTFVLGLGDQVQTTAPSTQMSSDVAEDELTFSVEGGQSVEAGTLGFSTSATDGDLQEAGTTYLVNESTTWARVADLDAEDELSAGDSITIQNTGSDWDTESISVVWEDQGQSSTLAEYEP